MAEETVNSLVTCGKSESDVTSSGETSIRKPSSPDNAGSVLPRSDRASSDSCHDFNDSRRKSTGEPSPQNSKQKVVPHYLRASTGSCHDFCKYGHKHAVEKKERYPWQKRIIRTPSETQNHAVSVTLRERKKTTVLKQMVSPDMKSHSLKHGVSSGEINSADPPEIIKKLPSEKVEVSPKCDALFHNKKSKAEKRMNIFSNKHSPPLQPFPTKQFSSFQALKSAKKVEKSEKTMSSFSQQSSPSVGPQPFAKKAENGEKMRNDLSQKSSPSVGQHRVLSKSTSSFRTPQSINGRGKRKDYTKASRNMVVNKASAKKVFATPIASLSPKPSMNRNVTRKAKKNREVVSHLNDQNRNEKEEMGKTDGEKAPEKILHVIVVETKNDIAESTEESDVVSSLVPQSVSSLKSLSQPLSPSLSSHEEREGDDEDDDDDGDDAAAAAADEDDDYIEDVEEEEDGELEVYDDEEEEVGDENGEFEVYDDVDDEEEEVDDENGYACETTGQFSNKNGMANNNDIEAVEGNLGKSLRKGGVFSESKNPRPMKLKFKRGKVVELQSENNGPRRLRFRRGRVMEENHDQKGEIRMRNFKKKGPDGDGNDSNPCNEKVVLRHQDMQGRKDAQGLFNNVIEETASKLVESRKSKVKALVGAFETVISLQDAKPSLQTVS
ncbi:hypothetical protein ACH5RR_014252 [Cinchona calisaya]|uniref:Calmodulin-binding domain-containing protein n=1 Tax=Cinchona calisaya TaxID=153742 RepID=A0ABD3A5Q8_9GENT